MYTVQILHPMRAAKMGGYSVDTNYIALVNACLPLLATIRARKATFQGSRPVGGAISEIVIHDTDSDTTVFETTVNYLANPGDGRMVSIHYIIGRNLGQILMMVPEDRVANHATTHNSYSIGIELWRNTKQFGYTDWQYSVLGQLVYDIMSRRNITRKQVVGHGFFDSTRGGEPKGFFWDRLDDELDAIEVRVKAFRNRGF